MYPKFPYGRKLAYRHKVLGGNESRSGGFVPREIWGRKEGRPPCPATPNGSTPKEAWSLLEKEFRKRCEVSDFGCRT